MVFGPKPEVTGSKFKIQLCFVIAPWIYISLVVRGDHGRGQASEILLFSGQNAVMLQAQFAIFSVLLSSPPQRQASLPNPTPSAQTLTYLVPLTLRRPYKALIPEKIDSLV